MFGTSGCKDGLAYADAHTMQRETVWVRVEVIYAMVWTAASVKPDPVMEQQPVNPQQ
jgi:hypothetical protein